MRTMIAPLARAGVALALAFPLDTDRWRGGGGAAARRRGGGAAAHDPGYPSALPKTVRGAVSLAA